MSYRQLLRALCKSSPELTTRAVASLLQPLGLLPPARAGVVQYGRRMGRPAETTSLEERIS